MRAIGVRDRRPAGRDHVADLAEGERQAALLDVDQFLGALGMRRGVVALAGGLLVYAAARPAAAPFAWSRLWHPTIAAVGIGALMIEIGFLLAYRGAWPVSTASVASNGLVAVLLVGVGATFFGEAVTPIKLVGVLMCLLGVILLQRLGWWGWWGWWGRWGR